jgi:creatinine amidohydrolase
LRLRPQLVAADRAAPGETRPLAEMLPELRRGGVRSVSANGVLGDPSGASAAEGAAVLDQIIVDLCAHVDAWRSPCPA